MPEEDEFSSTMRIDITPDVLKELRQAAPKVNAKRIKRRPAVIKVPDRDRTQGEASKYDQLLRSIYDGVLITDLDGKIVDANPRALDFFQFTVDEMRSRQVEDVIAGADKELLDSLRENLQKERHALIQAYCVRQDETLFPAEIAVNILRFSELRMCFFVRDITLRKQAEEMLRIEHNAIQNAGNGIAIADIEGMLEYVNPSVVKMWGYRDAEELVGRDVWSLFKDEDVAKEMVDQVLADQQWNIEMAGRRQDGEEVSVQVSANCNRDTDGNLVGMVFSFVDISDRKLAEEAMRQAEQQRVMLASLGAACHHLGQPATVILTNLELMKCLKGIDTDDFKELVSSSFEAAELMAELLHKLNTVAEYKTMQYIEDRDDPDSPTNKILDIEAATKQRQPGADG